MSKEENSQTVEGIDNPMTIVSYGTNEEVSVMLVYHNKEIGTGLVDLLKSYKYKVTTVGTILEAMSMLSKEKKKIDVILINVHSPNLLSFKLLAQAVALDIISLFLCDEHNALLAKKALEEGAYLYLKKPLDENIVKYLWQFVLRKKIQTKKVREISKENADHMNVVDFGKNNIVGDNEEQSGEKNNVHNAEEQRNNIHDDGNNVVTNEKYKLRRNKGKKYTKEIDEGESQKSVINKTIRQRDYTEWTEDLHAKFVEVVQQLGEGRCYPKDILEVMNVPGLTRMQVASHLQKCRTNNWRTPEERKSSRHPPSGQGSLSDFQQRSGIRKFGKVPHIQIIIPNQTKRHPEFPFPTLNDDSIFAKGESSIQQQLYRPQFQIQPQYLNTGNPLNNPVLLAQNNTGGALQQQHTPLFGMFGSQGLQGSIIGNTNYRPDLAFNSIDHDTQSDYSLDLNVAHGPTYSDNAIMFGTGIGNTTINDYNLNVIADNVTTYSGSAMMSEAYVGNATFNDCTLNVNAENITTYSSTTIMFDTNVENETINELEAGNTNFQQYIGEPNMSYPSNIIATSYEIDIEGSDLNERKAGDAYFNFNNMDYIFQDLGPPGANLPNEYSGEFDQIYYDDQEVATLGVQLPGIANYADESSIS